MCTLPLPSRRMQAQVELGRGRRARGGAVNYCARDDSMEEWLGPEDDSPGGRMPLLSWRCAEVALGCLGCSCCGHPR
jgi:hypothetical protein